MRSPADGSTGKRTRGRRVFIDMSNGLKFFNPDGSLREEHEPFGDPYRDGPDKPTFSGRHIERDDYWDGFSAEVVAEADVVVAMESCRAMSIAAQVHYSEAFAANTKGNYSAIYLWR
jgi:hypothetical protein